MDERTRNEFLHLQIGELTERTAFCPEDQVMAEYFDGELGETERLALERHLADCEFCLARVGTLERLESGLDTRRVPEDLLAAAKQLEKPAPPRVYTSMPAWAAAAMVVLAVFIFMGRDQGVSEQPVLATPYGSPNTEQHRQLRSVKPLGRNIEVFALVQGSAIDPGAIIRWAEVPDSLHYNVYVLSTAGDVLWKERLQGSEWILQDSLQLAAGTEYFFRVEASLRDGRTISSKHLAFRVKGQQ